MKPPFWARSAGLADARLCCSHTLKGSLRHFVPIPQTGWKDKWKQELLNKVFSWRCHYRLVTTEDGTTTDGEPELNTESLMSQWEAGVGAGEAQRGELCQPPPASSLTPVSYQDEILRSCFVLQLVRFKPLQMFKALMKPVIIWDSSVFCFLSTFTSWHTNISPED